MSKVDQNLVDTVFARKIGFTRQEVTQGPAYGVDCAIIEITDTLAMVVASDPLSMIPQIGMKASAFISLHLAANDIATSGLEAQYGQVVLNLPQSVDKDGLLEYWDYIHHFAKTMNLTITGGHSSFDALSQSTLAGGLTLFSIGNKADILTSAQAEVGDILLMTKTAGIASTSILAKVFPNYVSAKLGDKLQKSAASHFWDISVLPESRVVKSINQSKKVITAMHDVTEGGILGAAYEFAYASNKGVRIDLDKIPVLEESEAVANLFELDIHRIVGAGSMLIACKPGYQEMVIKELELQGIKCVEIGAFLSEIEGKKYTKAGETNELIAPVEDLYWSVFAKSMENGLS